MLVLAEARRHGPAAYAAGLHDLDALSWAKITELVDPRWVLPRVAVRGFGVALPPA